MINNDSLAFGLGDDNFVNKDKLEMKKRELQSTMFREREVDSLQDLIYGKPKKENESDDEDQRGFGYDQVTEVT
jgi:hypothetical protein